MPKNRSLSIPNVSYKNRHDTNFATKRKVFKGQPYPNGKADTVDTPVVICTKGIKDFNDKIAATTDNSDIGINSVSEQVSPEIVVSETETNSPPTENTVDTTDSSVDYATVSSDDETESFDENEINADESEVVFSGFSMENTKKELIEYAVANNIPVKSWWGKQKILDVLSN